jgi:hypothetical protein
MEVQKKKKNEKGKKGVMGGILAGVGGVLLGFLAGWANVNYQANKELRNMRGK